jgi:hypothetical protein
MATDRNRLVSNSVEKGLFTIGRNIFKAVYLGGMDGLFVSVAGSVNTLVRIVSFWCEAVIMLDECEGVVHQTSFTALVQATGVTVNQLLLR